MQVEYPYTGLLTSSTPAQLLFFPSGAPIHRITPNTVIPVLDITSTMDPTSNGICATLGLWLCMTLWSVWLSFTCCLRDPMLGMELIRDTVFLLRPGLGG